MSASSPSLSSTSSPGLRAKFLERPWTPRRPTLRGARPGVEDSRVHAWRARAVEAPPPPRSRSRGARRAGIVFWHIRPWIYVRETAPPPWSAPLHGGGGLLEYLCLVHLHRGDASNAGTDLGVCAAPVASLVLPQTNGLPGFCVPRCGQIVRYRVLTVYRTLGDPVPTCEEAAATARTRSRPFYALYIAHIALIAEGHGTA